MRARGLTVPLLCSLAIVAGAPAALAGGTSLYSGPGPRPGPDVLYGAPAVAPQLENVGVWSAAPILVSGASAYRGGEFLYQDFLYDDHGAAEAPDPTDPKGGGNLFSKPDGTYTYPTDPAYANDAADVVELRVKPLSDATAFRLTLNTMKDASLVAFSIAIGGTPGVLRGFPAGANVQAPADLFLTVHPAGAGMAGDLVNAATGQPVGGPAPLVAVDTGRRRQRRHARPAGRRAADRPHRPHPGEPLRDRAGSGFLHQLLPGVDERRHQLPGPVPGCPAALCHLRSVRADAAAGLRDDAPPAFAVDELQPVPRKPQPVAVRRPRRRLDRHHARLARPGRVLRQLRRARRLRGVGRRRAPLSPRPRVERDHGLLDGRPRDVQARGAVPRPVRKGTADRWLQRRQQPGPLAAQHPVPHVELADRRAGPADRLPPHRGEIRQPRVSLRARRLHPGRPPDPPAQRPVRAGGRVPRPGEGEPQPRARHLRRRPDARLPRARLRGGSRVLAVRHRAAQLDAAGHGRPYRGQHRRALVRIRRRRPDPVGHAVRCRHAHRWQPPHAARLHPPVPDVGPRAGPPAP